MKSPYCQCFAFVILERFPLHRPENEIHLGLLQRNCWSWNFILGDGEKYAFVFTDFHSLRCLSATSVRVRCFIHVACLLIFHRKKTFFYLVFLSIDLVTFPAFSCSSHSSLVGLGCCFLTMLLECEEWKDWNTRKCWGEGGVGDGGMIVRNVVLWQDYLVNSVYIGNVLWRQNLLLALTSTLSKFKSKQTKKFTDVSQILCEVGKGYLPEHLTMSQVYLSVLKHISLHSVMENPSV